MLRVMSVKCMFAHRRSAVNASQACVVVPLELSVRPPAWFQSPSPFLCRAERRLRRDIPRLMSACVRGRVSDCIADETGAVIDVNECNLHTTRFNHYQFEFFSEDLTTSPVTHKPPDVIGMVHVLFLCLAYLTHVCEQRFCL